MADEKKLIPSLRIPVSIVVEVAGQESTLLFFSQNLSMTGIYLESEKRLGNDFVRLGDELSIFFFLPSSAGAPIAARAKVVRREEINSFKGEPVHAIALEFINLDIKDQERLRLFIVDYETELEEAVVGEEREQVEITDPQSMIAALTIGDQVLFEPRSSNDYLGLCHDVFELDKAINKKIDVQLTPVQLLILEALEPFSNHDRKRLQELYWIESPVLRDKIFLNILFMRLKIYCEGRQLFSILQTSDLSPGKLAYLETYVVAVSYEADRLHEAAHIIGQKLVADEQWDDFKELNSMRGELEKTLNGFKEQMAPLLAKRQLEAKPLSELTAIINRRSIDDCLKEMREMIPDPEEEKDSFANGATGEDIRVIWDTVVAIADETVKSRLLYALAMRRQARDTLIKCVAKGDALLNHRSEVTELYRQDAKNIKEMVAELMALNLVNPKERDVTILIVRLLEALSYQFGKLVRTIPSRLLSQEEVETVRYRSSGTRQFNIAVPPWYQRLPRQVWLIIMALGAIGMMALTMARVLVHEKDRPIPLTLIEELKVRSATLTADKDLFVVIEPLAWERLTPEFRQARLTAFEKQCSNEGCKQYLLVNQQGHALAFGLKQESGMLHSQMTFRLSQKEEP